jgi:hypothetical protein
MAAEAASCYGGSRLNGGFMGLLDIVILILIISWLGGFSMHVGGGLVHLLLVIALVVLVVRLLQGRRIG